VDAERSIDVDATRPTAPKITAADLWRQFWTDAYGKEVQTAATYSYTWLADQFGHICIGILANFLATFVSGFVIVRLASHPVEGADQWLGFALAVIGVSVWEWCAYRSSVRQATGTFPLDADLLRDNAIVAAAYMVLGALLGLGFQWGGTAELLISAGVVVAAILLAPRWLRQKIIWQKAAIPYLFRLSDAAPTISNDDAKCLQDMINKGAPPAVAPWQVIIGGPIGSGRTSMAAGIATELAFKQNKVRYLSLDELLEFAANATGYPFPDDPGPTTIGYWPWSQAQIVIIDGVGPLVAGDDREANLAQFKSILQRLDPIAGVLRQCHTVWVLGDLRPPPPSEKFGAMLDEFADATAEFCRGASDQFVIELGPPPTRPQPKGAMLKTTRNAPHVATVQSVHRVSSKRA